MITYFDNDGKIYILKDNIKITMNHEPSGLDSKIYLHHKCTSCHILYIDRY